MQAAVRKWIPMLVPALIVAGAASVAGAEQVTVRAAPHKDYGRIVFKWPEPVPYETEVAGRALVVTFGAPIEASYRRVTRLLGKYIRSAKPGSDGRSVSFALKGDFGVRSFYSGAAVVVDLLDTAPAQAAAKQPAAEKQPAAAKAESAKSEPAAKKTSRGEGPSVRVRSGVHEKYTRLVFDWPRKVPYRLSRQGGTVSLAFEAPADIRLGSLARRTPRHVKGIDAQSAGNGVTVSISTATTSRIKHFYAGNRVVVDVMAPGTRKADAADTASEEEKNPRQAAAKKESRAKEQAAEPAQAESRVASKPQGDKPIPLVPNKPTPLSPQPETAAAEPSAPDTGRQAAEKPASSAEQTKPAAVTVEAGPVSGPVKAVQLRFKWDEPVAAAVFRRSGYLWTIFDKPSPVDVEALRKAGGNAIRAIEQMPADGATILRMRTVAGVNPALKRNGLDWILDFRKQPIKPNTPIEAKSQPNSPVGARLFIPVPEPGEAIAVHDPFVGDNLVVVPVIPLGHGVVQRHRYAQVALLPTAQGVVIRPLIDTLRVRALRQGIELTSQARFDLTPVTTAAVAAATQEKGGVIRELTRAMDLKKWRKSTVHEIAKERQKLLKAAAAAKGSSLTEQARFDLARFFLAHGFGAETLGVLRQIRGARPAVQAEAEYNMLHGVAGYLMRRLPEAMTSFGHKSLDNYDEGMFWRAILLETEGQTVAAAPTLRRLGAIIRPYPTELKLPLSLMIAESAVKVGDPKTARLYLKIVQAEKNLDPGIQARLDYAYGKFYELAGGFDPAVKKWEAAMKGPDRKVRARAAVARVELLMKTKKMDIKEAIAEYEKLRYAWRGDAFEFKLLRRLGNLYMEANDYRNGLKILKQAATHFRDHPEAPQVTQKMSDTFNMLFLENGADKLQPVTAIAIYEEFKELTPVGVKGDEMIRNLADRLVAVDLLGRGAKLLEDQIKFRLKGTERSRIGARLALVYIMNNDFEKALGTLDRTETAGMPPSLQNQRRHLRARAFIGLDRKEKALALLEEDESVSANLLRLDLFWNERDWPNVTRVLQQVVKQYGATPGEPLSDKQAKAILDMAVAMTLASNDRGINQLRQSYGRAMQKTPFYDAFRLITTTETQGLLDYRTISRRVKDVENFQSFMTAYRERLKKDKLSSLN